MKDFTEMWSLFFTIFAVNSFRMIFSKEIHHVKKLCVGLISLLSIMSAQAQKKGDLGTWNVLNLKYKINDTWSFFGEAQARSLNFYDNFNYTEYKGAANYNFNKDISVSLGTGTYQTFGDGGNFVRPRKNSEFRLWPQFIFLQSIGEIKIEHRVRAEMRFFENDYRNRFRYRLNLIFPFGKIIEDYHPYAFAVSDEVFFSDKKPQYARNRFLANFNFKPSSGTTIQCGYLYQYDYGLTKNVGRDYLEIGLLLDLNKI